MFLAVNTTEQLGFPHSFIVVGPMEQDENLDKAVRIRVDPELKRVIVEAARLAGRPEHEYTRHILRLIHGLPVGATDAEILERFQKAQKKQTHDSKKKGWVKPLVSRSQVDALGLFGLIGGQHHSVVHMRVCGICTHSDDQRQLGERCATCPLSGHQ